jgi:hypothetical protein
MFVYLLKSKNNFLPVCNFFLQRGYSLSPPRNLGLMLVGLTETVVNAFRDVWVTKIKIMRKFIGRTHNFHFMRSFSLDVF